MSITSNNAQILGNWWSLTESVQEQIKKIVPDKTSWTLHLTKTATGNGDWVFSLPQFLTFNEALTNGTEKSIDYHFEKLTGNAPVVGDTFTATISSEELPEWDTTLLHWDKDPLWTEANWYIDTVSDVDCWLCPYVQVLYKGVPEKFWIKFDF